MASDALSQSLLGLSAWFSRLREGSHEITPEGLGEFESALDRAAVHAIALEFKLEAALGRRPSTPEVLAAIRAGKVAVLPVATALASIYAEAQIEIPFGEGA